MVDTIEYGYKFHTTHKTQNLNDNLLCAQYEQFNEKRLMTFKIQKYN